MSVRTRFAPSPTGYLHVGGARTALFCWLHARHHDGTFVLRIEDTDRERSTPEAIEVIHKGLEWLGLRPDEGPYYQSERMPRYAQVLERLRAEGNAYHCYCSRAELEAMRSEQKARGENPRYDRRCRDGGARREGVKPVLRFANPLSGQVIVDDLVRGRVAFSNEEIDDLIIARSDGSPTYNLTVVVDDIDMEISHVIRGEDHLNNTPRQINIYHALDAPPPAFAHVPLIHGPDGAKLSKRHGAVSVLAFREEGILPEALVNYLVRLGWSHGDQEVFSTDEMIAFFDIAEVNRAASSFNPEKLEWLNQHYMRSLPPGRVAAELRWHMERLGLPESDGPSFERVVQVQAERVKTLAEMARVSEVFYRDFSDYDEKAARKILRPVVLEPLERASEALAALPDWNQEAVHTAIEQVASQLDLNLGKVAQPLRVALTGGAVSPAIDLTLELVGRERSLARIAVAIEAVKRRAAESKSR